MLIRCQINTDNHHLMNNQTYTIRTMRREELDIAIQWAADEGWNPGLHDADSFYAADPNGFLIGLLNDEPIACISVVKYGDDFGFLGFYIVKPAYRGNGYGLVIWKAGLRYLEGRNIGLDGVVDQQENYKKSGFKLAYRNIRYAGQGGNAFLTHPDIVPLSDLHPQTIIAYNEQLFPADRTAFLNAWLTQTDSTGWGILKDGKLAGYGIIRPCRAGYKIGPLFADDAELAETLFLMLTAAIPPSETVYLDTPEPNETAVSLAEKYGMTVVFETARMYTAQEPDIPLDRVFGVTTFELG